MFVLIAQNTLDIAGQAATISPIPNISRLIEIGADFVLMVGTLALLVMLFLGAFNWITAGGEKGKIEEARNRMTQAVIGIVILASVFAIYSIIINFFGLSGQINLTGAGGGTNTTGGGNTAQTCSGNVAIGATVNDGGSGGYCTGGGAAMVKCEPAGVGGLSYVHYEPCSCVTGSQSYAWPVCP